jgi:hypothetical protein
MGMKPRHLKVSANAIACKISRLRYNTEPGQVRSSSPGHQAPSILQARNARGTGQCPTPNPADRVNLSAW